MAPCDISQDQLIFYFNVFINVYVSVNVLVRALPMRSRGYML